ncbi:MAG: hypothetical protein H5U10_16930 [Desulfacinum sp.]|jgi:hypothetical protein|nr:hypothetical protein [Desulfacinum sp.]
MKFRKTVQLLVSFFEKERIDYALIGAFALQRSAGFSNHVHPLEVDGVDREEVRKIFRQYGMEDRYEQLVS